MVLPKLAWSDEQRKPTVTPVPRPPPPIQHDTWSGQRNFVVLVAEIVVFLAACLIIISCGVWSFYRNIQSLGSLAEGAADHHPSASLALHAPPLSVREASTSSAGDEESAAIDRYGGIAAVLEVASGGGETETLPPEDGFTASQCCICQGNGATMANIPCGHVCLCGECAKLASRSARHRPGGRLTCPICRNVVTACVKLYAA